MSTRAIIGIKCATDSIRYIRVERDGYPAYTADILVSIYNTVEKVDQLISLGNLSHLGGTIKGCVLYYEQESERDCTSDKIVEVFGQLMEEEIVDYGYLFMDNKWKCWSGSEEIELAEILAENPLMEAQGLIKYVVNQAEAMKDMASKTYYTYRDADRLLGILLQNIQKACKDIDSLIIKSKTM